MIHAYNHKLKKIDTRAYGLHVACRMFVNKQFVIKMNFNCSTISKAIIKNDVESFKELLNKRKRVDIPDNLGYTSLHIAAEIPTTDPYIIDTLLNHPDIEVNLKTVEGFTSLYVACKVCNHETSNIETIQKLLVHGADTNIADVEDISPIHIACKRGNLPLVELLVKYNADVNSQDFNKYTPLHYAIEYNHENIVEYLLRQNADADIQNLHGLNALMFAIEERPNFAHIFVDSTTNLNAKTRDNLTALHLCVKRDNYKIAECLIRKGAELYNHKTELLMYALTKNKYPIYKLIWDNLEPRRLRKYDEIFRKVLIHCNAFNDFRYLLLIINDNKLSCDIRGKNGVLAFIFYKGTNLNVQYTELYFQEFEAIYRSFFACLLKQGIRVSSADVESFIFYFYKCPYRIELLKQLLDNTKPDITKHLVVYAFQYDLKMGAILLQYCLHVYPENLYDHLCFILQKDQSSHEVIKYFLRFFTPNKTQKNRIFQKLLIDEKSELYDLLTNKVKVKSLRELSRDVVRERLQENSDTSCEFLEQVAQMEIPTVIKDYILLKLSIRNI